MSWWRSSSAPSLTVLIPAHNEAEAIGAAIESVIGQDGVDELIVVADNCSDATAQIAAEAGATVVATVDNTAKKAGALNQLLAGLLSQLSERDYVMVMDADSILDRGFVAAARSYFARNRRLGGVSGTFRGGPGGGFVGMLQRNEYARYARDVRRLKGRALVLTGTATVFRVSALRHVLAARRDGRLPDGSGQVYDEKVLTEDNELTLALLHLGWRIVAPRECRLTTEVMESWSELAKQRLRWKRGALENIADYGLTRVTVKYWGRQAMSLVSVGATGIYLAVLSWSLATGSFALHPFWLAVTAVFVLERVVSVRARGWKQQLLAVPLVVEMVFDVWLQFVQARAFMQVALGRNAEW